MPVYRLMNKMLSVTSQYTKLLLRLVPMNH